MAECRSCRAPIIWAVTASGSRIPVDAEPTRAGNVVLEFGRPGEPPSSRVVSGEDRERAETLHTAHFVTCPHAKTHRKRKVGSHRDRRR